VTIHTEFYTIRFTAGSRRHTKIAIFYFSGGPQNTLQMMKLEINQKVKIP
jgi:hypothetical protein